MNRVIRVGESVVVSNTLTDEDYDLKETLKFSKIGSVMCLPLSSEGRIIGVLYIDSIDRPHGFRKGDLALLSELSQRTAPAVLDAIRRESIRDTLSD